jgi:hypothetical protein
MESARRMVMKGEEGGVGGPVKPVRPKIPAVLDKDEMLLMLKEGIRQASKASKSKQSLEKRLVKCTCTRGTINHVLPYLSYHLYSFRTRGTINHDLPYLCYQSLTLYSFLPFFLFFPFLSFPFLTSMAALDRSTRSKGGRTKRAPSTMF